VNLIEDFLSEAQHQPERVAIIDKTGRAISYGDLATHSGRLAAAFADRGIGAGDRVLIGLFPGLDLYAGLAALWRLGAVAVFPEPAMGLAGFRHAATATGPKGLLAATAVGWLSYLLPETRPVPVRLSPRAADTRAKEVDHCLSRGPDDPALISFTSGSTGLPKAIERSHGLMRAQHLALAPLIASEREEIDVVAFPAFVLTCIGHGTTAVLPNWNLRRHDRMQPETVLDLVKDTGATRLLVPPVVVSKLVDTPLPESLHRVMTGGGPLYPDIARQFLERHPGIGLTNVYGSTEAEPIAHAHLETLSEADWTAAASGGGLPVGTPVAEVDLKLSDSEILVSGPHVNRGYLDPARNIETKLIDGNTVWHRTGDAGRLDTNGRLWLLGRHGAATHDLFGFSVETAARLWPGVTGAAFAIDGKGCPVLFLSGNATRLVDWQAKAKALGTLDLVHANRIPMDRRHRSKPDTRRLLKEFGRN